MKKIIFSLLLPALLPVFGQAQMVIEGSEPQDTVPENEGTTLTGSIFQMVLDQPQFLLASSLESGVQASANKLSTQGIFPEINMRLHLQRKVCDEKRKFYLLRFIGMNYSSTFSLASMALEPNAIGFAMSENQIFEAQHFQGFGIQDLLFLSQRAIHFHLNLFTRSFKFFGDGKNFFTLNTGFSSMRPSFNLLEVPQLELRALGEIQNQIDELENEPFLNPNESQRLEDLMRLKNKVPVLTNQVKDQSLTSLNLNEKAQRWFWFLSANLSYFQNRSGIQGYLTYYRLQNKDNELLQSYILLGNAVDVSEYANFSSLVNELENLRYFGALQPREKSSNAALVYGLRMDQEISNTVGVYCEIQFFDPLSESIFSWENLDQFSTVRFGIFLDPFCINCDN